MSVPSNPVNIRGRLAVNAAANGVSSSHVTPIGTPDLRALRAHYVGTPPPNIPLRNTATPTREEALLLPASGSSTPISRNYVVGGISAQRVETPTEIPTPLDLDDLPEEEKAKVLRRHLVSKEERHKHIERIPDQELPSRPTSAGGNRITRFREDTEPFPIPYDAPGADITHDIYKWQSDQRRQAARQRAASFSGAYPAPQNPAFEHIHEPGGFRRNFVLLRADEQGMDEPPRILNNFIDFLFIYGHFAGEDLEDDEVEQEDDEEVAEASILRPDSIHLPSELSESTPLLQTISSRSRSRSRRRRMSIGPHGDATVTQAVLMLLKSFIGTGVLFLGRAFLNGGILFSAITIVFVALISLYSFLLLVKTKFVVSGSFGDLGGTLYGPWMRYAILGSIVLSQLGFVAAYTIFVSENLQAFVMGITHCAKLIPLQYFIMLQMIILLPLALIRDLAKLSTTALVADVFILAGLIYIFGTETSIIAKEGIADVKLFNPKDFPLFIGTAVFSFEGIGLVIPITDSMREPRKFPKVITGVMIFLTILFGGAGALSYLTFGSSVQTVVLVNFDSESKFVQAVQFLYAIAILLSVPLQLFPAVRIMENGLFIRSGKADTRVKWLKNIFRFSIVLLCSAVSWVGAADLDKFVAFVGSFACVPLCYIYPAMLHYRACARTRTQKLADITMMIVGSIAAVYTTAQTISLMMSPGNSGLPKFGQCS